MSNRGIWHNDRFISNPTRKQRRKVHRMLKYVDSPFFDCVVVGLGGMLVNEFI